LTKDKKPLQPVRAGAAFSTITKGTFIMANWCRTVVRVLGPEPDVVGFVAFVEHEDEGKDGTLTALAECSLDRRAPGRAKYELISKWRPPLDALTQASERFPSLALQVEWEEPAGGVLGCAVIANGNKTVLDLDDLLAHAKEKFRDIYQDRLRYEWNDNDDHADVALSWEILREATRRFFSVEQREEEADDVWAAAKALARQVVQESDDLLRFTGGGIVTVGFDQWQDRSALVPGEHETRG
jgi:hypothetical protein